MRRVSFGVIVIVMVVMVMPLWAADAGMVEEKGVVVSAKDKLVDYVIKQEDGKEKKATAVVLGKTKIIVNGEEATLEKIKPGMLVTVTLKAKSQIRFAEKIEATSKSTPTSSGV